MKKTGIGIVGCGMISGAYFKAAQRFRNITITGCCDTIAAKAEEKAAEFNCKAMSYEELINHPEVEIVLNLTPPKAHCKVLTDALNAGKHAYTEKPFGVDDAEVNAVCELASAKGLRLGCAPDTFLGGGLQTARKLIDDNWIGKVLSGTAIVQGRGPEKWGHAPFFYDKGAGPMLDLGPYYVTALVSLLGPAKAVTAVTARGSEFRTFGDTVAEQYQDKYKPFDNYPVNVDTHQTGIIEFANGAVITVIASFDVFKHGHNPIELYGSEGSLIVPDPNTFGGDVKVFRPGMDGFQIVPKPFIYTENSRSIGIADMAKAIADNRPHRASCELARHVIEIMFAFERSSAEGRKISIKSSCERPAPLPLGLSDGELD